MIRLVALLFLCAGCGRLEFGEIAHVDAGPGGATPDGSLLSGHDEDGDGLDDKVDPCPGDPGTAADTDGDGVGDDCDPSPNLPTETLSLFATLQPGDVPFDAASVVDWAQGADGLMGTKSGINLNLTRAIRTARIEMRFEITAVVGAGQHQVACGIAGGVPYYFAELNENPSDHVNVVSYDMANGYITLASMNFPTFHTGAGMLIFDGYTATKNIAVTAGWTNEVYNIGVTTPAYAGGSQIVCSFNGIDVEATSFTLIETP